MATGTPHMEDIPRSSTDATASRNALQEPVESTNNPGLYSEPIRTLVQQAMRAVFNDHPLCAIAEEHRKKAEALAAKPDGNPDAGFNNNAVYNEYCKYLILHPHTESPEYRKIFARVYDLEQARNAPADESPNSEPRGNSNGRPRGSNTNYIPIGLKWDPQWNGVENPGSFPALNYFSKWNFLLLGLTAVNTLLLLLLLIGVIGSFFIQEASAMPERG
ncbi:hypothetical protein MVEN_01573400 [Mycena venus]|uniref:Uncharacterized protein n=1 Tax=Mycena venus TaxID=2733690 RepID=A0A8H6XSB6_9AGAR|nr:hypothetical protein MVEN_01573400 [Mycena venus]